MAIEWSDRARSKGWKVGAAASLLVLMTGAGAVAAWAEVPPSAGETVMLSVIGELPRGRFDVRELQNVGVTDDEVLKITRGAVPSPPMEIATQAADPNNPYQIMATWSDNTDSCGAHDDEASRDSGGRERHQYLTRDGRLS